MDPAPEFIAVTGDLVDTNEAWILEQGGAFATEE